MWWSFVELWDLWEQHPRPGSQSVVVRYPTRLVFRVPTDGLVRCSCCRVKETVMEGDEGFKERVLG